MSTEQLLALETFSSDSFLVINKTLIKILGLQEAVFLSNLIDKFKYFSKRNMVREDGGFFLTFEDQEEQTSLSIYQLRKCKKNLIDKNILKTYIKGIPPKEFYILNIEQLINIIKKSNCRNKPLKTKGINPIKTKGIYKDTKYKDTKEKTLGKKPLLKKKVSQIKNLKPSPVIIKAIIYEYNKIANKSNLPEIKKITPDRKDKIRTRAKNLDAFKINDWKEVFNNIPKSNFLCGDNDRGWKITFDWLINSDKNFSKVLEGNYTDTKKKTKIIGLHKEESWDDYEPDYIIEDEDL